MDVEKYIASGILEQYVAGNLSKEESLEVQHYAIEYPKIQEEIESIEMAVLELTKGASPGLSPDSFNAIKNQLVEVIPFEPNIKRKATSWTNYLGWAASLVFAVGLFWMYLENDKLQSEIEGVTKENTSLEDQILDIRNEITGTEALLNQLRDQSVSVIALGGQAASPEAYAKVYWNKEVNKVFIDAQGLPEPPPGYNYQVWSLKFAPLTPTSIGLLEDFAANGNKVFELENPNNSEAFGITLEPEGGSASPTLDQLYALGATGP
ncbi:MAG: anti-sigma factor [Bacteroidota bacterium]